MMTHWVQEPLHCIGHLEAKHLGEQGSHLHVMQPTVHNNCDPLQVLLHCIGHMGVKVISQLDHRAPPIEVIGNCLYLFKPATHAIGHNKYIIVL